VVGGGVDGGGCCCCGGGGGGDEAIGEDGDTDKTLPTIMK